MICRSGGDLSFRSGPNLPGRGSAATDVLFFIRDRTQMGIHCFPENVTYTPRPITLIGANGIPPSLTFSSSMVTFSRLSVQGSSPLISKIVISPVSSGLNGTVIEILNGSNMSTCMGNEEWEPDPREVQCTGGFVTTGATPTSGVV